jgi:enoyl-CoA hydratase/carnithine racemase
LKNSKSSDFYFFAQRVVDCATMLATRAPLSHRYAKEVVRCSMGKRIKEALKWESRSFRDVAFAADLKKGVTSFKERREAKFRGN